MDAVSKRKACAQGCRGVGAAARCSGRVAAGSFEDLYCTHATALGTGWGQQRHDVMARCWRPGSKRREGEEPRGQLCGDPCPASLPTHSTDISTQGALTVPTTSESLRPMHTLPHSSHPTCQQHSMPLPLCCLCPWLCQPSLLRLLPVPVGISALPSAGLSCPVRNSGLRSCCLSSITDSWVTSPTQMVSCAI